MKQEITNVKEDIKMTNNWKITALCFGKLSYPRGWITGGLDPDIIIDGPLTGYLLQNGKQNILVDTGIGAHRIVNGKSFGYPAVGGEQFVLDELAKEGLTPKDIDTVMYTHLHNDHVGAMTYFPEAKTYFQKDELTNLLNPLPSQKKGPDYEPHTITDLQQLKNIYMVDGDIILGNGLEIYKVPGHSSGSMAIVVPTAEGRYVICGDTPHTYCHMFPKTNAYELIGGEVIKVTPVPDNITPYFFSSLVYDHYAAFDSYNKLKVLAEEFDPKWFLTGHDSWIINKRYFG